VYDVKGTLITEQVEEHVHQPAFKTRERRAASLAGSIPIVLPALLLPSATSADVR